MEVIKPEKTSVLLIGTSVFDDKELSDLPAALDNITELKRIFVDKIGIPIAEVKHKIDITDKSELLIDIKKHAKRKEYFILYYAGHGILDEDDNDKLYFSIKKSTIDDICFNGISVSELNKSLNNTAKNIILIIDACFSEKAFEQIRQRNYFIIASSSKIETSKYPINEHFSAFTNELINVLNNGIDTNKNKLSLNDIYIDVRKKLLSKEFPEPKISTTNQLHELILLDNTFNFNKSEKQKSYKREPEIHHALPPAPRFVGRKNELKYIQEFWERSGSGILSIEAIGGSGKTAITQHFLEKIISNKSAEGIFVWSFYDEPDTNLFFQYAYQYFSGSIRTDVKGYAWLHLLKEVIGSGNKYLLILDGLEKVQYEKHNFFSLYEHFTGEEIHAFGEIQDVLLKELLKRLACFGGNAKIIITTRFPVVDLQLWHNKSYFSLDLSLLDEKSALALLRKHKISGSNQKLLHLIETYGTHALTLDHLGTLIKRFFKGNPDEFSKIDNFSIRGGTSQARRLASIFKKYEQLLPKFEKEVLGIICIFRVGISVQLVIDVFKQFNKDNKNISDFDITEAINNLVDYHLVLKDAHDNYTVHPAIRDHFYQIFDKPEQMHQYAYQTILSLTDRPGKKKDPYSIEMLNNYEELIYHLLKSNDIENAKSIYFQRLGGYENLANKLGEFLRGYRILSQFPEIIDYAGWLKYRLGIGDTPSYSDLVKIKKHIKGDTFGIDTALLLSGNLIEADKKQVSAASFLIGKRVNKIYGTNDAIPKFSAYYYSNTYDSKASNDGFGNNAVKKFLDAEKERKSNNFELAGKLIQEAEMEILSSGSQPHLCVMHLVKSRLALDMQEYENAYSSIYEGLEIAKNSGFRIFEIDLLLVKCKYHLMTKTYDLCCETALQTYSLAKDSKVMYVWGAGYALLLNLKALKELYGLEAHQYTNAVNRIYSQLSIFYAVPANIVFSLKEYNCDVEQLIAKHDLLREARALFSINDFEKSKFYYDRVPTSEYNIDDKIRLYNIYQNLNIEFDFSLLFENTVKNIREVATHLAKKQNKIDLVNAKKLFEKIIVSEFISQDVIDLYKIYRKLELNFNYDLFLKDTKDKNIRDYAKYFSKNTDRYNLQKAKQLYGIILKRRYTAQDKISLYEVYQKLNLEFDFKLFFDDKSDKNIREFAKYFSKKEDRTNLETAKRLYEQLLMSKDYTANDKIELYDIHNKLNINFNFEIFYKDNELKNLQKYAKHLSKSEDINILSITYKLYDEIPIEILDADDKKNIHRISRSLQIEFNFDFFFNDIENTKKYASYLSGSEQEDDLKVAKRLYGKIENEKITDDDKINIHKIFSGLSLEFDYNIFLVNKEPKTLRMFAKHLLEQSNKADLLKSKEISEMLLTQDYVAMDKINIYNACEKLCIEFDFHLFSEDEDISNIRKYAKFLIGLEYKDKSKNSLFFELLSKKSQPVYNKIQTKDNSRLHKAKLLFEKIITSNDYIEEDKINLHQIYQTLNLDFDYNLFLEDDFELLPKYAQYFHSLKDDIKTNSEFCIKIAKRYLTFNDDNSDIWFYLGYSYAHLGDFTSSIDYYNKCLDLCPKGISEIDKLFGYKSNKESALNNIGVCYSSLNQTQKAIEYYEKAHIENSKEIIYLNNLIDNYFRINEYQKSYYYSGIKLNNDRKAIDNYLSHSWYCLFAEKYDEAIQTTNLGLQIDSNYITIYTNLIHAYLFKNEFEKAFEIFEKYKTEKMSDTKVFKDLILDDFKTFKELGIKNSNIDKMINKIDKNEK